jgi:ribosomal protein L37AE/L43A
MECKNCKRPIVERGDDWVHADGYTACDLRITGGAHKVAAPKRGANV